MDISKMTETELKALAFDEEQKIRVSENNLRTILSRLEEIKNESKQPQKNNTGK